LKLVIRHLAPLPTSDARLCSAAAAAGLRRALRIAAMRLWASCLFIWLNDIFLTQKINMAIWGRNQVCDSTGRAF